MRREGVLLDLPDGDGVKKRAKKSGNCEQANKIHAPFRSLTLCCRSRCFLLLLLGVPISVLLAARSLSSDERLSSTSIRQSRTHDGKRKCTADLHREQHRRERIPRTYVAACATADSLCPCAVDCRARRAPISSTARGFGGVPRWLQDASRSGNHSFARQALGFEVHAHTVIKDTPSHPFFGAVPGTHPTACKRPSGRPRRGAAKPQNPAPRPNQPLAEKTYACPDRGGRGASNEPLQVAGGFELQ